MPLSLSEIDLESGNDASKRAAVDLCISKADGQQTEENQCRELPTVLQRDGYGLAGEVVGHESVRKIVARE